jgi:hypothetical protein
MGNPYLDDASLRWAAAEGVPEAVIAAICLLPERNIDDIVTKLSSAELEHVIKIVGLSEVLSRRGARGPQGPETHALAGAVGRMRLDRCGAQSTRCAHACRMLPMSMGRMRRSRAIYPRTQDKNGALRWYRSRYTRG